MKNYKVVIGIPTINRADLLKGCLKDIAEVLPDIHGLIIVDNGLQKFKVPEALKDKTHVHSAKKNLGVAASWNYIMKKGFGEGADDFNADYVYIINDDVVLGHSLESIYAAINENPDAYNILGSGSFSNFLVAKKAYYEIGRFDETFYPAYFEDNDWDRRCSLSNTPSAVTKHLVLKTFRNSCSIAKNRKLNNNFQKNRKYFMKKWGGPPKKVKFKVPFDGREPDIWSGPPPIPPPPPVLINVLIRTSRRPHAFKRCVASIRRQRHKNVRLVVGSDHAPDVDSYIKPLLNENDVVVSYEKKIPNTGEGNFPYNLYINELFKHTKEGLIITLDDDDEFVGKGGLEHIANAYKENGKDKIYVWKTKFPNLILPRAHWGKKFECGDIPSCGTAFHTDHKEVATWDGKHAADYRSVEKLDRHLKQQRVWIDGLFAKLQTGPRKGKPE
jgi:hypothetical protein